MSVLTRRERVASNSVGGVLYYGERRQWPRPRTGEFEMFATHPESSLRPSDDLYGHCIFGITSWAGSGGVNKLYMGYGSLSYNMDPIYITPLNFDGTWDATVWPFVAFGLQQFVHKSDGQLMATGLDGPADFVRATPGSPATWIDGWCSPAGFNHPLTLVEHDGYEWVCGQTGAAGSVWRGTHVTGNDGAYVLNHDFPSGVTLNRPTCMFSFQDKLWYQSNYINGPPSTLKYWVEATDTWFDTGLTLNNGATWHIVPWGSVMVMDHDSRVVSFNGTTTTTLLDGGEGLVIYDIALDADDNVWVLFGDGRIYKSEDLTHWALMGMMPNAQSVYAFEDYLYVGDNDDHVWRAWWGG